MSSEDDQRTAAEAEAKRNQILAEERERNKRLAAEAEAERNRTRRDRN